MRPDEASGRHEPVLVAETLEYLQPSRGGLYIDCTVGQGGHARALLAAGATRLIGLDRDPDALTRAADTLAPWSDRVELIHADYRRLDDVLGQRGIDRVAGALVDLGLSSLQLESAARGFSFQRDGALDMRFDQSEGETAADWLRRASERDLADVIYRYGEERRSRRVAKALVDARRQGPIDTTHRLAAIIRRAVGRGGGRIDPATRTFQALRIWVNRELEGLDQFLVAAARHLDAGARLVVIAFHSLEDRVVKHTLKTLERAGAALKVLTKKPVIAGEAERRRNPRARSAKLRAMERVS